MRRLAAIATPFALAAACAGPFSNEDIARLHSAEEMMLLAYDHSDAATPAAQFDRAAFCDVQGVLRESDAGRLADASIKCDYVRK